MEWNGMMLYHSMSTSKVVRWCDKRVRPTSHPTRAYLHSVDIQVAEQRCEVEWKVNWNGME